MRQEFKTKEVLLELNTKPEDFVSTRIQVNNYQKIVKDYYGDLEGEAFEDPKAVSTGA